MLVPVPSVHADIQHSVRSLSPRVNVVVAETDLRSQTGEDRGNVGEWHAQVDATCITAATMPRPTDRRLAVPCSGGALDDRVVAPPTAPTGASLPPEHRSHQSIAPTGAPLPLEHRSHRSHGHGSRHGASRRPTMVAPRDGRPAFTVLAPPPTGAQSCRRRSCVRVAWSLDKPARHRHARESLSRPLPRSAAPSSAKKSPSHSSESRAYVYWSP